MQTPACCKILAPGCCCCNDFRTLSTCPFSQEVATSGPAGQVKFLSARSCGSGIVYKSFLGIPHPSGSCDADQ